MNWRDKQHGIAPTNNCRIKEGPQALEENGRCTTAFSVWPFPRESISRVEHSVRYRKKNLFSNDAVWISACARARVWSPENLYFPGSTASSEWSRSLFGRDPISLRRRDVNDSPLSPRSRVVSKRWLLYRHRDFSCIRVKPQTHPISPSRSSIGSRNRRSLRTGVRSSARVSPFAANAKVKVYRRIRHMRMRIEHTRCRVGAFVEEGN